MAITILCGGKNESNIPSATRRYWQRKDLWQKREMLWDKQAFENHVLTINESLVRVHWNINVLFWLLHNPEQIPKSLRGKNLVFEGTIFTDKVDQEDCAHPALFWDKVQKTWTWYLYQTPKPLQKRKCQSMDIRHVPIKSNKKREIRSLQLVRT